MSLNHVCIWSKHGWTRITAQRAASLHPGGTVSARSGLFMCELCGQFVEFTDGPIRNRYFRHKNDFLSKDCPDRTDSQTQCTSLTFTKESRGLPMRIKILSSGKFTLEMGFRLPPNFPQRCIDDQKVKINSQYEYSLSRLQEGTITYLPVGEVPQAQYRISLEREDSDLAELWPAVVEGISPKGAMFDRKTGKKLPRDADVLEGHEYYLLTKEAHVLHFGTGININEVCTCLGWHVYRVYATSFCENAAKFFLKYCCRLAEKVSEIVPLWPVHVETPYLLLYDSNFSGQMAFFLRGNASVQAFPTVSMPYNHETRGGRIFYVKCGDRQQLIAAGRAQILRYAYIWKDTSALARREKLPEVQVTDSDGSDISSGEYSALPRGKTLAVTPPFDGYALVLNGAEIVERYSLSAGTRTAIQCVKSGYSVEVYQGLDLVRRIEYKRPVREDSGNDETLRKILESAGGESISVPHTLGGLAAKMRDYPQVKSWLAKCIRRGRMSQRSYKILAHHFSAIRRSNYDGR